MPVGIQGGISPNQLMVNGNPNGVVPAPIYTIVIDRNTGTQYQNTDGGTTWVALTAMAGTMAGLTNTGALVESGVVTVTGVSGTLTNYAPTGVTTAREIDITVSGFTTLDTLAAGQVEGRMVRIRNNAASVHRISISHEGSGTAANRFLTGGGGAWELNVGAVHDFEYRAGRWQGVSVVDTRFPSLNVNGSIAAGGDATLTGATNTIGDATTDVLNIGGDMVGRTSTGVFGWAASTDPTAAKDAGLKRIAAGKIALNDGGTNGEATRDLYLRHMYLGGSGTGQGITSPSIGSLTWVAGSDTTQARDTGLSRNAAGVVEVNNGTAGTLRDLTLRKITASDRASLTGLALTNYASASPSGAVNDYALVDVSTQPGLRLDAGVATVISGLAISQVSGSVVVIHNISAVNSITLTHDTLSTAANRFYLPNNADVVIRPNGSATFRYDGTSSRWRMIGSAL